MSLGKIHGIIRRRMLVNFRIEPEIIRRLLPDKFRPKLHDGAAIAGICLIRLEQMRPAGIPSLVGAHSENAAHRIAVLWDDSSGQPREGVFVVRRDTDSLLNALAGGWLFPGEYHRANFRVSDSPAKIDFAMKSADDQVAIRLRVAPSSNWSSQSSFKTLKAASDFFEAGSLGWSATSDAHRLDGMTLRTEKWEVAALEVDEVYSSYFSDETLFPKGSVIFDCALIMRDIKHAWQREAHWYI